LSTSSGFWGTGGGGVSLEQKSFGRRRVEAAGAGAE